MQTQILCPSDAQRFQATHLVIITHEDVAALGASATGVLPIVPASGNAPAGTVMRNCRLDLITAFDFSDDGITSLLIEIGDDTDTDRVLAQTEIAVDGTEKFFFSASPATAPAGLEAANTFDAKFTAANGGSPLLSECNAGELRIYFTLDYTPTLRNAKFGLS